MLIGVAPACFDANCPMLPKSEEEENNARPAMWDMPNSRSKEMGGKGWKPNQGYSMSRLRKKDQHCHTQLLENAANRQTQSAPATHPAPVTPRGPGVLCLPQPEYL